MYYDYAGLNLMEGMCHWGRARDVLCGFPLTFIRVTRKTKSQAAPQQRGAQPRVSHRTSTGLNSKGKAGLAASAEKCRIWNLPRSP